jgi:dTDP-4-dehydrorhamnose reductase
VRFLVTGARGLLGSELVKTLVTAHEVVATDLPEVDLTDRAAASACVAEAAPDLILHCVAYTAVDQAEAEPDRCYAANVLATWHVVTAAHEVGASVLYLSTDFVFDGQQTTPYTEFDPPHPLSVYGRSKWMGEQIVRQLTPRHFIVRTSGLFGPRGKNFVSAILAKAWQDRCLEVVADQVCARTYAPDLARALQELCESGLYGAYHLTNQGASSWYEFAGEIVQAAGLSDVEIRPITAAQLNLPAPRPAYSVLDNFCWRLAGHASLREDREALRDYLDRRVRPERAV